VTSADQRVRRAVQLRGVCATIWSRAAGTGQMSARDRAMVLSDGCSRPTQPRNRAMVLFDGCSRPTPATQPRQGPNPQTPPPNPAVRLRQGPNPRPSHLTKAGESVPWSDSAASRPTGTTPTGPTSPTYSPVAARAPARSPGEHHCNTKRPPPKRERPFVGVRRQCEWPWPAAAASSSSSGLSTIRVSVVNSSEAIEAALASAERVTLTGSMTPAASRSPYSLVAAL
jgi:hypothetical protein